MNSTITPPLQGKPLIYGEVLFDIFPGDKKVLGGTPFSGRPPPVEHLVDTVGAGDAFCAVSVFGLHQAKPYPLSWAEQDRLVAELPRHLANAALFAVNTRCREQEICQLCWDWEVEIPELETSVFILPESITSLPNTAVAKRQRVSCLLWGPNYFGLNNGSISLVETFFISFKTRGNKSSSR